MVRLHFLNEKGWELPDFYDCGPKDYESEKHALEIITDALIHTINMTDLKGVDKIRVIDSEGNSLDFHKDQWCFW
ncbi:MAG: hypothetical protein ACI38Y_05975 [Candidatus Methanomethylophilaceae archaeon]